MKKGDRCPEEKRISVPVCRLTLDITERGEFLAREDTPGVAVGPDALRAPPCYTPQNVCLEQ